jgi:YD repeat-containing protein
MHAAATIFILATPTSSWAVKCIQEGSTAEEGAIECHKSEIIESTYYGPYWEGDPARKGQFFASVESASLDWMENRGDRKCFVRTELLSEWGAASWGDTNDAPEGNLTLRRNDRGYRTYRYVWKVDSSGIPYCNENETWFEDWGIIHNDWALCPAGYKVYDWWHETEGGDNTMVCGDPRPVTPSCPRGGGPYGGLMFGNPIDAATGNKIQVEDYVQASSAGGFALRWTYKSGRQSSYRPDSPLLDPDAPPPALGPAVLRRTTSVWMHRWEHRLYRSDSGTRPLIRVVRSADLHDTYFHFDGTAWKTSLPSNMRLSERSAAAGGGYLLFGDDDVVEQYDSGGRLVRVSTLGGLWQDVVWNGDVVDRVQSWSGRTLKFTYTPPPRRPRRLESAVVNGQTALRFDFDRRNLVLREVRFADDHTRRYGYDFLNQHLLISIDDEAGNRLATYGYDAGQRASSSWRGIDALKYGIVYPTYTAGGGVLSLAQVTAPTGATATIKWRDLQKVWNGFTYRYVSQFLDSVSARIPGCENLYAASTNDSAGNLTSRVDFSDRKTCYAYDQVANAQKNLENVRVEGFSGSATCPADLANYQVPADLPLEQPQRKITTRWHPAWRLPVQQAEPLRITSWVYNGQPDPSNGNKPLFCAPDNALLPGGQPIVVLCKRIEQATGDPSGSKGLQATPQGLPRQWSYTYNRFGQKLSEVDPRAKTSRREYFDDTNAEHTVGDLRTTTNAADQTSRYSRYDKAGRLLTMSDANGVVTQYSHTPRGWLKSVTMNPPAGGGASEVTGYDHYPTGLLKLATLPDGSTLKYDYDDAHRLTDITDSAGNTVHYTLDEMGNRKGEQLKDQSGTLARSITRVFDDLNRLQNVTGAPQ